MNNQQEQLLKAKNAELEKELALKNRELEIEASLDRLRSRMLRMQKSSELEETTAVMYQQLDALGVVPEGSMVYIVIIDTNTDTAIQWIVTDRILIRPPEGELRTPMTEDPRLIKTYEAWKRKDPLLIRDLIGKELDEFKNYLKSLPSFQESNSEFDQWPERLVWSEASFSNGTLGFICPTSLPAATLDILVRFAKDFDLAYTRFLDLQKAEEQAREARIEASLERVRARSIAMHKSEELSDTATVLFRQLRELGGNLWSAGFVLLDSKSEVGEFRMSNPEGEIQLPIFIPNTKDPATKNMYNYWENGADYYVEEAGGKDLKKHYDYLLSLPEARPAFQAMQNARIAFPTWQQWHAAYFSEGYLLIITMDPFKEIDLLKRFAKAFQQTYTRFLDIQKAESQAREAQIEAALERVRSRTMAMHTSDELREVVSTIFEELQLSIDTYICILLIFNWEADEIEWWSTGMSVDVLPESYKIPLSKDIKKNSVIKHYKKNHQKQTPFCVFELEGETKLSWDQYMFEYSDMRRVPQETKEAMMSFKGVFLSDSYMNCGVLEIAGPESLSEDKAIVLQRFAKVIDQTYTRFLDLKKAEAQAREAQIESAMERIRSTAIAMRSSEELMNVITELRRQIDSLGQLDLEASVIHLYSKNSPTFQSIAAVRPPGESGEIILAEVLFPVDATPQIEHMISMYESKLKDYTVEFDKEQAEAWQKVMIKHAPMIAERREGFVESTKIGDWNEYWNFSDFSEGSLLLVTHSPASEDTKDVLKKAAQVFDLAYQRYRDLIKAEERTREAIKEASIDRVRGEIASMRTSEDLNRITPVIWHELKALEVPFFRCGVFIMDENTETVQVYLSSPDGQSFGELNLSFDSDQHTFQSVQAWRKDQVYIQHWDSNEFLKWTQSLMDKGQIQNVESYQGAEDPPESLDLHFIPFTQGMLYVGNTSPLEEHETELVKSLAKAFALAYARYEDFVKLEKAKQNVESTLTELKSTQAQLIQSEKMASLGELTAGIAHEIQNPLNFVNNFSEVNVELTKELEEEIEKGDLDEAKALSKDIRENQEKIMFHGKRAESIVNGMLQHSRSSSGEKIPTDINAMADEYLRLAYHGFRAKDKSFNANFETELDERLPRISVVPQDIGRVLLNLFNNAFHAVKDVDNPKVLASTRRVDSLLEVGGEREQHQDRIEITISDNGPGIPADIKDKIFQPFFTTKPTGEGTGLGLSLSYDIIKAHGGEIKVVSNEQTGTEFRITLPT